MLATHILVVASFMASFVGMAAGNDIIMLYAIVLSICAVALKSDG